MTTSSSATVTQVAASATSVQLLPANDLRASGSVIYNDSSATLYVLLGSGTASSTNWSVKMNQDDYFQLPDGYSGSVQGVWASATGQARVSEAA